MKTAEKNAAMKGVFENNGNSSCERFGKGSVISLRGRSQGLPFFSNGDLTICLRRRNLEMGALLEKVHFCHLPNMDMELDLLIWGLST